MSRTAASVLYLCNEQCIRSKWWYPLPWRSGWQSGEIQHRRDLPCSSWTWSWSCVHEHISLDEPCQRCWNQSIRAKRSVSPLDFPFQRWFTVWNSFPTLPSPFLRRLSRSTPVCALGGRLLLLLLIVLIWLLFVFNLEPIMRSWGDEEERRNKKEMGAGFLKGYL